MLTPEYLDRAPDDLVRLMQQMEEDILLDVARRIGKMGAVTDTAQWQLWRLGQIRGVRSDVVKLLARYSGRTDTEIRSILQASGAEAMAFDDEIYRATGLDPSPVESSAALNNLLNAGYRQTRGTWQNLTATTANTVTGQFEAALDRVWLQVSSGAFDYNTAIRRAVNGLARHMDGVTYPSGRKDTLEVAVRRAVLTGVNQTAGKLQVARMDEMGCEFVEVTAHSGARPSHAAWQGKVYHRGNAVTYQGKYYPCFETATGYGSGDGLCGWNCRHNFYPFFPGLSQRAYTDNELTKLNAREYAYQGGMYTKYELSQIQRGLERKVRAAKKQYLAEDAAGLDATGATVKYRGAQEALKRFCRETGFPLDSGRTGKAGFGHSQASKATWIAKQDAQKAVASTAKHGTMKETKRASYTRKQLEQMPIEQLRSETAKLAAEWYKSGRSGISFPAGTDFDAVARQLAASGSRTSLVKDFRSIRAQLTQLDAERAGLVTTNAAGSTVTILTRSEPFGVPDTITQVSTKNGGISRNYYGSSGEQFLQISSDDHGNVAESGYGKHGEHAHDYTKVQDGPPKRHGSRELTDQERKENEDIL